MKFRPATPSDVKQAETRIDLAFKSVPLPSPQRESSLWHILTVSEDRLRMVLWHATHEGLSENVVVTFCKFISEVDKSKFALRYPRNLLSLHARVDAPSFDKQSERFEDEMVVRIKQKVLKQFSLARFNVFLPQRKGVGEIDMLLVDELNRTIMIGELRWLLTPGDPREINNRKKVCAEKIEQIHRKTEAAREVILEILESFSLEIQNLKQADWKVVGIVIVDGYVTASTRPQEYPLVPVEIFSLSIEQLDSLALIHDWLSSSYWLPRKGKHYISEDINAKFAGQDLRCSGLRVFHEDSYMHQYLPTSLSEFKVE